MLQWIRESFKRLLVRYHSNKSAKEVDLEFYAVTLDFGLKGNELATSDLFSGFLCKEQVKWQTLLLMFAVYNMFAVPFSISVSRGDWPSSTEAKVILQVIEIVGDILFLFEVLFNFYLPFEEEGVQINIHKLIHKKYVKGWLAVDIIGAIPADLIYLMITQDSTTATVLRLNKLVRFFRLNFYWGRMERNLLNINPSLIRLGKFIFLFILAAHWIACLWLEVIRVESWDIAVRWVGLHSFEDLDKWGVWNRYFQAFYWALVTMVGYGGTVPHSALESIFSFAVVSVGVVMYVVVIGTVGTIAVNLDAAASAYGQKIENVNAFFRLRNVPHLLAQKIRNYHGFMWRSRQGIDAVATINDLPQYLRVEIATFVCRDMMTKVPLFKDADAQFFRQLAASLKPLVCLPNTRVVTKGEMGKEMYFISKGSLAVLIEYETETGEIAEKSVCTLEEGQHFGEIALLCKSKRSATIQTNEFCDLFVLKQEDFRLLLWDNPEMATKLRKHALEQYPTLKEQLSLAFGQEMSESGDTGTINRPRSMSHSSEASHASARSGTLTKSSADSRSSCPNELIPPELIGPRSPASPGSNCSTPKNEESVPED